MRKLKEQLYILGIALTMLSPWIYNIVYCFKNHEYVLLMVGAAIPPVGWIHGLGAFFNWW